MKNLTFHSTYPVSIYILFTAGLLSVIDGIYSGYSIVAIFLYGVTISSVYYALFARFACSITLAHNVLSVRYIFSNEIIKFDHIRILDHKKGYYDLFAQKSHVEVYVFPVYCYDTLVLGIRTNGGREVVRSLHINTIIGGSDRLMHVISKMD